MASLCTINEYRPKIAASAAMTWISCATEADMGRMVVAESPHLDVDIDINGLSSVSTSRKYYVCRKRAAPVNADD